jgi:hypothetical protein
MDQKAAYEITITEKLEQLSVPDMVDAIWARIETQLDIDMPTDDGPANPPGSSPSGSGLWNIAGLALFIAALVAVIYFTNKKPNNTIDDAGSSNTGTIISAPGNTNDKPPPSPTLSPQQQQTLPDQNLFRPSPLVADSAADQQTAPADRPVINNIIDSAAIIAPPVVNKPDSTQKKGRGVKGISDNDYRVTPAGKDSS